MPMHRRFILAATLLLAIIAPVHAKESGVASKVKVIDPLKLPYEAPNWKGVKVLKPLSRELRRRISQQDYFEEVAEANVIDRVEVPDSERYTPLAASLLSGFDSIRATGIEPPDPHLAVGPSNLMAATNANLQIYSKTGSPIGATLGLKSFFAVPSGYNIVSDPKFLYDTASGRFFGVLIGYNSSTSVGAWFIATSTTNSASGTWNTVRVEQPRDLPDYPGLGICSDKLVVTANNFDFSTPLSNFTGAAVVALNKSQLTSGAASVNFTKFSDVRLTGGAQAFTIQAAQSLSTTSTCHMVALNGTTRIQLYRVTGLPSSSSNATLTTGSALTLASAVSTPATASQQGSTRKLAVGDTRLLDATYRNGSVWTASNTGCTFSGRTKYTCAKLVKIGGVDATPSITQEAIYGASGFFYTYPALRTDSTDNMTVVFTRTGSSEFPGIRFGGLRAGSATFESSGLLVSGGAAYTGTRWGDYHGAAWDSTDNSIWIYGMYKPSGSGLWGTYVGKTKY